MYCETGLVTPGEGAAVRYRKKTREKKIISGVERRVAYSCLSKVCSLILPVIDFFSAMSRLSQVLVTAV